MSTIDKITMLLKEQGKTQKELTDYLGITKNAFTDWKSGRIKSYTKHLDRIAEFFNVSVDYLLGKEKEPSGKTGELDELTMQFNNLLGKLSQEQKEALIPLLESMIQQKK